MQNQNTDPQKKNKAYTAAALRALVSGYLIYLGFQIMTNQDTTMPVTTARLLGSVMILAALLFAGYVLYRLKTDLTAAQKPAEPSDTEQEKGDEA